MGGSSSKSKIKNENNTKIVNESDLKILNEQINNTSSSVAVDAAKSCSSSVNMTNMIDFSGATIDGDFNIGDSGNDPNKECAVELSQDIKSTFKCVQASSVRNDMGIKMIETIMGNLENAASAEVLNDMDNAAGSKAAAGSLSFGSDSKSNSEIENINNYESVTKTNKQIENIVKNSVEANFSSSDAQECINKVNAAQGLNASGAMIKGSVNVCNFKSAQVANIFGDCMQKSDVGNKIINDIARNLDISVKEDSSNTVTNESENTAESSAETTGLLQDMGGMIESIGSAFSGLLGLGFLGSAAPFISPVSFAISCCCCCMLLIMMMFGGKSSSSSPPPSQYGGGFSSTSSIMFTPDYDVTTHYSNTSPFT